MLGINFDAKITIQQWTDGQTDEQAGRQTDQQTDCCAQLDNSSALFKNVDMKSLIIPMAFTLLDHQNNRRLVYVPQNFFFIRYNRPT